MSELSDSGLPPVQRVVTGHNEHGRAVFKSEDVTPTKMIPSGDASFLLVWTTDTVPADNNDETDGRDRDAGTTLNQGSVIRIVDMLHYPARNQSSVAQYQRQSLPHCLHPD
jgi:hypothetical protein